MQLPAVLPGPGRWLNDGMGAYVAAQLIKVMGLLYFLRNYII